MNNGNEKKEKTRSKMNIIETISVPAFIISLWASFGFILPILLITAGGIPQIITAVIFMIFGHAITIIVFKEPKPM